MKHYLSIALILITAAAVSGCIAVAAGVGAEAGYVASQNDRTASETLEDQRIVATVKTKLLADSDVSGLDINVDSFKSVVTLRGFVDSNKESEKAIALARSVAGVLEVKPQLVLKE